MLKRLSQDYQGSKLVLEKVRHEGSLLEAELQKDSIYAKSSRTFKPFKINYSEISGVEAYLSTWESEAIKLPGFTKGGSSIGGINAISYYEPNSEKEIFCITGHENVLNFIKGYEYSELNKKVIDAELELNKQIFALRYDQFIPYIARFFLTLERKENPLEEKLQLNKAEVHGIKEVFQYYQEKRKLYHPINP